MEFELFFTLAICIDLLIGDPGYYRHPVQLIGSLCTRFELFFRRVISHERISGILTTVSVIACTVVTVYFLYLGTGVIHSNFQLLFLVFTLYSFIAIKDLYVHSNRVFTCLFPVADITKARTAIGMIVGRDTADLTEQEVGRACVETVAENMVDGITSPVFWAVVFSLLSNIINLDPLLLGTLGIAFYKSINTMDSMFGYKNERYLRFGSFPAKLDDAVNYIPARISGLCIVVAALLLRLDYRNAFVIFLRDRNNHTSPNAGHPEAAVAGALGIQLGGSSAYFDRVVVKPTMGDRTRDITANDILSANRLTLMASFLFLLLIMLLRAAIVYI